MSLLNPDSYVLFENIDPIRKEDGLVLYAGGSVFLQPYSDSNLIFVKTEAATVTLGLIHIFPAEELPNLPLGTIIRLIFANARLEPLPESGRIENSEDLIDIVVISDNIPAGFRKGIQVGTDEGWFNLYFETATIAIETPVEHSKQQPAKEGSVDLVQVCREAGDVDPVLRLRWFAVQTNETGAADVLRRFLSELSIPKSELAQALSAIKARLDQTTDNAAGDPAELVQYYEVLLTYATS